MTGRARTAKSQTTITASDLDITKAKERDKMRKKAGIVSRNGWLSKNQTACKENLKLIFLWKWNTLFPLVFHFKLLYSFQTLISSQDYSKRSTSQYPKRLFPTVLFIIFHYTYKIATFKRFVIPKNIKQSSHNRAQMNVRRHSWGSKRDRL